MPSDERIAHARAALAARRSSFRAALAATRDQVLAHLAAHGGSTRDRVAELRAELGGFAGGKIDAARLAAVVGTARGMDPQLLHVVRRSADVLDELLEEGDALFTVEVQPGADLRATVFVALAEIGRAFGAALAFHAATTGTFEPARHEAALHGFPFALWNRAERALGVPLVVRVAGADLCAEALAEFLDGRQQIVLVVDGPCAPAPLARLVSAGVLVLQATDDLGPLASFEGPAIAALVPEGAAEFIADPRAGGAVVVRRAAANPTTAVGRWSVAQQREQVAVLTTLERTLAPAPQVKPNAEMPDASEAARVQPCPPSPVHAASLDRSVVGGAAPVSTNDERLTTTLADWLLAEAGFTGGVKA